MEQGDNKGPATLNQFGFHLEVHHPPSVSSWRSQYYSDNVPTITRDQNDSILNISGHA